MFMLSDGADRVRFDPATGHLGDLLLNGCDVLHRAPWLDAADVQADDGIPLVERRLQGDFFCAPFGKSDLIDAPIHGATANSAWDLVHQEGSSATWRLRADVMGALVDKTVTLQGGALMQTHRISGGRGGLPVAHHPMVHMADGGVLSFSPKRYAITPDTPLEPERNWLSYPAQSTDLQRFPGVSGKVDLTVYPTQTGHEDFVTLIEAEGAVFGWTAVARKAEKDLIVLLKDPATLPVTMLWLSNGGRDYAPWNGRHTGVLGIEDGCAAGAAGHRAALGRNALSDRGVRTALPLAPGQTHVIRHAIFAIKTDETSARIANVMIRKGDAIAQLESGTQLLLGQAPFWLVSKN